MPTFRDAAVQAFNDSEAFRAREREEAKKRWRLELVSRFNQQLDSLLAPQELAHRFFHWDDLTFLSDDEELPACQLDDGVWVAMVSNRGAYGPLYDLRLVSTCPKCNGPAWPEWRIETLAHIGAELAQNPTLVGPSLCRTCQDKEEAKS